MRRVQNPERGQFCRAAGTVVRVEADSSPDPARVDHVLFHLDAGGPLIAAVNTLSRLNRSAGFEARIYLGIVPGYYEQLPDAGLFPSGGLDYTTLDETLCVDYRWMEQKEMEWLLREKGRRCVFMECWGEVFIRQQTGLHQIHSRHASCAVQEDFTGRDGALKFYFDDLRSELLLLKFCGQP